jgi:hypothetical protein
MKQYKLKVEHTTFICESCKTKEKIPTQIVIEMDLHDEGGDLRYPPRFRCESCTDAQMYPLFYESFRGIIYTYDPKTGKVSTK